MAEVHGNLSEASIPGPPVVGTPKPMHVGDMIFDARTGNLLVAGYDG